MMIINHVAAYTLRLPNVTDACDGAQDAALIKITTVAGIVGWGEVDSCPSVVKAIVDAPLLHQLCNGLANILRPSVEYIRNSVSLAMFNL